MFESESVVGSAAWGARRAKVVAASRLALVLLVLLVGAWDAQARGITSKLREKRVARVVRITHPSYDYREVHHCALDAWSQDDQRVLLWNKDAVGGTSAEWGFVSALTSWRTEAEFLSARRPLPRLPNPASGGGPPLWSEVPGESHVLYALDRASARIMRIDLRAGTSTAWVTLPGSPSFATNLFLPGFSTDHKLVVWEDPDDDASRLWEVDLVARTALIVSSPPAEGTDLWRRYPLQSHGHSGRSPNGMMRLMQSVPDIDGYTASLRRYGDRSLGLIPKSPVLEHAVWRNTDSYAFFSERATGTIHQIFTDGTLVRLLDLRLSNAEYYRVSSFPNVNHAGDKLLYSSDAGDRANPIGIFVAFLDEPNAARPVHVDRFVARPAVVRPGSRATLSWVTANATNVTVSPGGSGLAAVGSLAVTPAATTTYVLRAEGVEGPITRSVTVEVASGPTDTLISNGSMEQGVLGAAPTGWSGPTSLTLVQTDSHDFNTAVAVRAQRAVASAKISRFASSQQAAAAQGRRVKLSAWVKSTLPTGSQGDFLQIEHSDPPRAEIGQFRRMIPDEWTLVEHAVQLPADIGGYLAVSISATPANEDVTVLVDDVSLVVENNAPPPVIEALTVTPSTIQPGEPVRIAWRTRGATSLLLGPAIGRLVSDEGSIVLGGDLPSPDRTTVYTLTVQGDGGQATANVTLTVGSAGLGAPGRPTIVP